MKKALLAALCFIIVSLMLVNGTFATPDFGKVFQVVAELLDKGTPEQGGSGTSVHVDLVSDNTPQNLYPGGKVSRDFQVQNLGDGDVYFRLVYAIQYDAESWPKLDIDFSTDGESFAEERSSTDGLNENGYDADGWKDIFIGSTPYKMKVFTYTKALKTTSPKVTISIAMDATITSEQLGRYRSDFMQTQVLAIETKSFNDHGYTTAVDALDAALPLNKLNPF